MGKTNFPYKRALNNRLVTRLHVISQKWVYEVPLEVKKGIYLV